MDALEAHARFARFTDRSVLPCDFTEMGADYWPACATALASLSGMLDDCRDDDDLAEALEHGVTLLECGVLSLEQVGDEATGVVDALMEWGDALLTVSDQRR